MWQYTCRMKLILEQIDLIHGCTLIFRFKASSLLMLMLRVLYSLIHANHLLPFFIPAKDSKSLVPEGTIFYSCEVCQAKFVNKWTAKRHMRWHNQPPGKYLQKLSCTYQLWLLIISNNLMRFDQQQ